MRVAVVTPSTTVRLVGQHRCVEKTSRCSGFSTRANADFRRHFSRMMDCFRGAKDDDNDNQRSLSSLHLHSMSFVAIHTTTSLTTNRRFASTTTNNKTTTPQSEKSSVESSTMKTTLPADATEEEACHSSDGTFRDRLHARAGNLREAARHQITEFREHPGQSARDGAKSFGGMVRKYGPVFVGTYATVYFSTLGLLFLGVESGVLDPVQLFTWFGAENGAEKSTVQLVVDFLKHHTVTEPYANFVEKNPSMANLAVAWISIKFTEPVRLPLALTLTPHVARYIGWSKKTDDEEEENLEEENKTEKDASSKFGTRSKP